MRSSRDHWSDIELLDEYLLAVRNRQRGSPTKSDGQLQEIVDGIRLELLRRLAAAPAEPDAGMVVVSVSTLRNWQRYASLDLADEIQKAIESAALEGEPT